MKNPEIGVESMGEELALLLPRRDLQNNLITTNHLVSEICGYRGDKALIIIPKANLLEQGRDRVVIRNNHGEKVSIKTTFDAYNRPTAVIKQVHDPLPVKAPEYEYVPHPEGGVGQGSDFEFLYGKGFGQI